MKIVLAHGYFDPVHSGHIMYLQESKKLGNKLWVIVNNDVQAELKKERYFMKWYERFCIISNLKDVDKVILSIDGDRSVNKTLQFIRKLYPNTKFIFTNGGDVTKEMC